MDRPWAKVLVLAGAAGAAFAILRFLESREASIDAEEANDASKEQDDAHSRDEMPAGGSMIQLVTEIGNQMEASDPEGELSDADMRTVSETVMRNLFQSMATEGRTPGAEPLDQNDRELIQREVRITVRRILNRKAEVASPDWWWKPNLQFQRGEHVVVNTGSEWISGTIQKGGPEEASTTASYSVKLDPPMNQLTSVPLESDNNDRIRLDVCFHPDTDGLLFTLFSIPQVDKSRSRRRFSVGDRVACAIKGSDSTASVWATGLVTEMEISMQKAAEEHLSDEMIAGKWPKGVPAVPYRVTLDDGRSVLVHKDQHWLIRDAELQIGGTRLQRIETRQRAGAWEAVDHMTRQVRHRARPDDLDDP